MAATSTGPTEEILVLSRRDDGTVVVQIRGSWTIGSCLPSAAPVVEAIEIPGTTGLAFEAEQVGPWDSALLTFVIDVCSAAQSRQIDVDPSGLPDGVRKLVSLATAVPARSDTPSASRRTLLARIGETGLERWRSAGDVLAFIGETGRSFVRLFTGRANFRRSDLVLYIQQAGAEALPIVSLISLLIGAILAFVGSVQLKMFGAQIYVANLVGIAMVREMGAMMTAIIMAGRTGAAFAAQLGTMQVNEEIDALKTLGVPPSDYLVLPRMLALIVMMPLLTIYANIIGIFGGYLVGVHMLDLSAAQYVQQTLKWIKPNDLVVGLGKSVVFGVIIALCGCLAGIASGRSAAAVGKATTAAVVTAIVWIIVADGIAAVLTTLLRV